MEKNRELRAREEGREEGGRSARLSLLDGEGEKLTVKERSQWTDASLLDGGEGLRSLVEEDSSEGDHESLEEERREGATSAEKGRSERAACLLFLSSFLSPFSTRFHVATIHKLKTSKSHGH